jgi:hypothetical protein
MFLTTKIDVFQKDKYIYKARKKELIDDRNDKNFDEESCKNCTKY